MKKLFLIFVLLMAMMISCSKDDINRNPNLPGIVNEKNIYRPTPSVNTIFDDTKSYVEVPDLFIDSLPIEFYDGLVAYYPFIDSINGASSDKSPNELNGEVLSITDLDSTQYFVETAVFNQENDSTFIEVPDTEGLLNFSNTFSLCVWFNNSHIGSKVHKYNYPPQTLLSKPGDEFNDGYELTLYNWGLIGDTWIFDHRIEFQVKNNPSLIYKFQFNQPIQELEFNRKAQLPNTIEPPNNMVERWIVGWHFVVATFEFDSDNSTMKLYVDGTLRASDTPLNSLNMSTSTAPLYIGTKSLEKIDYVLDGGISKSAPPYFYGKLDNIMIFDYALSEEQVLKLYQLRNTDTN